MIGGPHGFYAVNPSFDLQRFIDAQRDVFAQVCAELTAGDKRSHWMWFVFPQLRGLGHSAMSRRYALASRAEAAAYLAHPLLGARLRECTALVLDLRDRTLAQIFGSPDDLKFRSSMTLFAAADESEPLFTRALERCDGPDELTLAGLRALEAGGR